MPKRGTQDGFVFIETLMETVSIAGLVTMLALIGVQSTIAATNATATRQEARYAAIKSDLETLAAHQTLHYIDQARYTSSAADLRFRTSDGVRVHITASAAGWFATAGHAGLDTGSGCAIYVGSALPPIGPVVPQRPGEVACTE